MESRLSLIKSHPQHSTNSPRSQFDDLIITEGIWQWKLQHYNRLLIPYLHFFLVGEVL